MSLEQSLVIYNIDLYHICYSQSATNASLGNGVEKEVLFMLW